MLKKIAVAAFVKSLGIDPSGSRVRLTTV